MSHASHRFDVTLPTELTRAESEVVCALLRGLSNAQIARERATSQRTTANQVAAVFRKLGVSSRPELFFVLAHRGPEPAFGASANGPLALSGRARRVLRDRALGHSLKVIACELKVSTATVSRELSRGIAVLGLRSAAELARFANAGD